MRKAFKMKLRPGMAAEYKKRHDAVWPEVLELIRQSGVSNYSIFLDPETNILFAVQEVSGNKGSQDLGNNPVIQKWWEYMADIMETNPDSSPVNSELSEVFHLD